MQLENCENFKNTARIYRQNADLTHSSLSAIQRLRKSHYTNEMIVDEQKSMPLLTFIRTGDSYFREKEHHSNTMVSAKGYRLCSPLYPWPKVNGFILIMVTQILPIVLSQGKLRNSDLVSLNFH